VPWRGALTVGLSASDFAEFLSAVHGHSPFPWQQKLVDCLADGNEWPGVLDLPTGSGKTAALDAAVFHLALCADSPGEAPLRVAFVVDRRLVVDDAFSRAERIADALRNASRGGSGSSSVVGEVASRLQRLAGRGNPPLVTQRLRGGVPLEDDWARTPTQPTVLCSTVDQVGSRLLFRGYGVSDRMKPVHAGLLGVNSLILLDEAHLSEPFRQTLHALRELGGARTGVALLSATPGESGGHVFRLSAEDREHQTLKKRLEASKRALIGPPVRGTDDAVAAKFASKARQMMGGLRKNGVSGAAVGVIVNRVALARWIFESLADDDAADAVLLIGRSRDVDRDEVAGKLAPFRTGGTSRDRAKPLFVVATQCLEVGVDIDLDGLVAQAASLDALRQRFGRLNRAGRPIQAEGVVLARSKDVAKRANDPVYGDRIRKTWDALRGVAAGGAVDFGLEALPRLLSKAGIAPDDLAAKRPNAPVVMPAYLDLWSQTSPTPVVDPEVSLFLHGAERTAAGVSIVWRGDLSEADLMEGSDTDLTEVMRLVPPRAAEAIELPLSAVRAWLRQSGGVADDIADVPAREPEAGVPAPGRKAGRSAFRWAGHDSRRTGVVGPDALRPGDLVVVPAVYGGCDRFGWAPDSVAPVSDVADAAAAPYSGRRWAVRVARDVVWGEAEWERVSTVLADESLAGVALVDRLLGALPSTSPADEGAESEARTPRDARAPLERLQNARGRIVVHRPYGDGVPGRALLVADRGVKDSGAARGSTPATEDETASHTSSRAVVLDDHCRRVAGFVRCFARNLGVKQKDDLVLAALLHAGGKADPRFQTMLSGRDPWNRPDGAVLAKGGRSWSPAAWANAGLPRGWRHEALSVRMARRHPRLAEAHDRKLVLWLIGSHHGRGRPFFDFLDPKPDQPLPCLDETNWRLPSDLPGPQSLAFDLDGSDWPCLFEDLKRRYGIWGLAHLEAMLRLADHRASEEEGRS